MKRLKIDQLYLTETLLRLLAIPSPSGYTDTVVHFMGEELDRLGIEYELTRRGAIRGTLRGKNKQPNRAIVAHLDTLGAMVKRLKSNGRLGLTPIGTWSSRFAEGARVTVFTDDQQQSLRGTILPLKASGHVYHKEIDTQPVTWDQVEVRIDEDAQSLDDLRKLGLEVGDFVAVDPQPEVMANGYIVSRHLDNKAGVASLLASAKALLDAGASVPIDVRLLFTIFEEVGSGASTTLHQDVAEMVSVDNATPAPGQAANENDVTIAVMDSSGPFDYHLTRALMALADAHDIPFTRDVMNHYRCDAASAVEAGNDIRTALICFGADASHGYERTHIDSLMQLSQLIGLYMQSQPAVRRDRMTMGPMTGFPEQPTERPPVPEHKAPPA